MRLSVELVPRDAESLAAQLDELVCLGSVDTVNVPDLAQFALRGWQAALQVRSAGRWAAVPHFRAAEVLADEVAGWPVLTRLRSGGIDEVLVVSGDALPTGAPSSPTGTPAPAPPSPVPAAPPGAGAPAPEAAGPSLAVDAIRSLRAAHPDLRVYAALDPYRSGFAAELAYAEAKLDAGADGLFTQPFFDLRLLAVWQELTSGLEVFWGVTSVTSPRSQRYWLSRNRAVFPAGFEPTLAWHRDLAARVLEHVAGSGGHLYFMPIRVSVRDWLGDLLG
ncbi:MAG TPA: methylenetetrahydrofolate reductase [Trueperaceae bacterium]|jgi:methylenetetrahydrofolate reductase (NADPH)